MADKHEPIRRYRLAILIDGDNASPKLFRGVFQAVNEFGRITVCRVFGAQASLQGWHGSPVRRIKLTTVSPGKNATDIAMTIDAMDLLHDDLADRFAVVSSDADFTPLAERLRKQGKFVIGAGDSRASIHLRDACDHFIDTDKLATSRKTLPKNGSKPANNKVAESRKTAKASPLTAKQLATLGKSFGEAFAKCTPSNGWVSIGVFGKKLHEVAPSFSHKTYGSAQLRKLLERCSSLVEIRRGENAPTGTIDVRLVTKHQ